jgi:hypothetical protein
MRSNVAPFLWFVAAVVFAVVWRRQDQAVYVAIAVVFAILGYRSYTATKRTRTFRRPPVKRIKR